MVDIHTHILPKIDDGAKNGKDTFEMIRLSIEDGITDIVATPHYCLNFGEETFEEVKRSVSELRKLLKEEGLNIKVHYGQEVYYSTSLLENLGNQVIGTINNGRYMLLELNMKALSEEERIFDCLYELKIKGIIPIIAHPERYEYIQRNTSKINRFIEEGCLFQLNGGSIEGRHSIEAQKCARVLLKNRIYSFIGSDTHDLKNRKPGINTAIDLAEKIDKGVRERFKRNGEKLLKNEKIEFSGDFIKRGRRKENNKFSFF